MKKLDKDFLKKNQFWVILGAAVFLWVVSLALVMIGPKAKADEVRKAYEKSRADISANMAYSNESFIKPWEERKKEYLRRKNEVWEAAWKTQTDVMTWPPKMSALMAEASFGDLFHPDLQKGGKPGAPPTGGTPPPGSGTPAPAAPQNEQALKIHSDLQLEYKNDLYKAQFASLEAFMNVKQPVHFPIEFDRSILGQIAWKEDPTVEECWLAQEEIWVRREVFNILLRSLESIATFKDLSSTPIFDKGLGLGGGAIPALVQAARAKPAQKAEIDAVLSRESKELRDRPLQPGIVSRKLFRNHNWEVELMLEKQPNSEALQVSASSTIKNINKDRTMPLTNAGKGLLLQIKRRDASGKTVSAPLTRIEGQLLQPDGIATFNVVTRPENFSLKGDFELEEVFDPSTSPIRKLQALTLGQGALPHRIAAGFDLQPNRLAKADAAAKPAAPATPAPPVQPGVKPGQPAAGAGGIKEMTENGLARNRYTVVTDEVRRIPFAFVVVVDQSERNQVLTSVVNSKLRAQVTQVYWKHLEPTPEGGKPMGDTKIGALNLSETTRNQVELTIHGTVTLYERFKGAPKPPPPK